MGLVSYLFEVVRHPLTELYGEVVSTSAGPEFQTGLVDSALERKAGWEQTKVKVM